MAKRIQKKKGVSKQTLLVITIHKRKRLEKMNIYMRTTSIPAKIIRAGDFKSLKEVLQSAIKEDEHIVRLTFNKQNADLFKCNLCVISTPGIRVAYDDIC